MPVPLTDELFMVVLLMDGSLTADVPTAAKEPLVSELLSIIIGIDALEPEDLIRFSSPM